MPEFEEYIVNSSLILTTAIVRYSFAVYLLPLFPLLLYMCPHAFLQRHVPFLYRTSSSNSAARVQANDVAVPPAIQDVCIAVFVKMFVSTFNFSGD